MRFFLPAILCILSLLILGGCTYRPPIKELPEYGRDEIAWEEIEADSIYQRELKFARMADSSHNGASYYVEEGFKTIRRGAHSYAVEDFNKAWLLDSLNPHVYMGFALTEMWKGNVKSAVKYYAKYRELYEKNPVPRFPAVATSDSVTAVPSDSVAATPDTSLRESYVYGKLVPLKNDWGFRLEPEWCDVSISSANEEFVDSMLNSDVLPENERLILYRHYIKSHAPVRYVEAEIKVLKIFDKASGKWVAPPKDSVYRFSFVEREGLFLDEEARRLVELRTPSLFR